MAADYRNFDVMCTRTFYLWTGIKGLGAAPKTSKKLSISDEPRVNCKFVRTLRSVAHSLVEVL